MDSDVLVENQIDDGQLLIDQLTREEFEVLVAFWLRASEEGQWRLYIASPAVDPDKMGDAYRRVYASLKKLPECWVLPSDLKLVNGADPLARAAKDVRDRFPGKTPTRFHGKRLGNLAIEEAYIYPPPGKWFKGFDEIKQNFPSAEVFTIPVLFQDVQKAILSGCNGAVNEAAFEGHPSGTVLFMGPRGKSGKPLAELYFVYRPEGWNTLYRADTGNYEEVRHVDTNQPLYRSADYGPLAVLKAQMKPAEEQIERIRAMMQQGFYITLPPDETPIYGIPYVPSSRTGGDPPPCIDWEWLRRHLESGGRITLQLPGKKVAT